MLMPANSSAAIRLGKTVFNEETLRLRRAPLTVINFTQTTLPLPDNAGRCLAFIGKIAFIKNRYRVPPDQQCIGFPSNLPAKPNQRNLLVTCAPAVVVNFVNFPHAEHVGTSGLE
ncbi:MAG: hypothetical protein ACXWUD_11915 [Methylosarcina sp.]